MGRRQKEAGVMRLVPVRMYSLPVNEKYQPQIHWPSDFIDDKCFLHRE